MFSSFRGVPSLGAQPAPMQWAAIIAVGLVLTMALSWAAFPAAMLIGPMLASTLLGLRGATVRMPLPMHRLAQGVAGCLIAQYLTPDMAADIARHWPAVLVFVLLTLTMACLVGWTLGFVSTLDHEVAIWGFLPGMAGTVIAMSHERGLDSRLVAFIQILRVVAVILVMSAVSRLLAAEGGPLPEQPGGRAPQIAVLVTMVLAGSGVVAARYLSFLPAAATLVPLILTAALQSSGLLVAALPGWLLVACYLILGSQVGLRFTPAMLRSAAQSFWAVLGGIAALMALCTLCGAILAAMVGTSLITGMLAMVPGSIETVALIAISTDADMGFVLALQVVRLFAVVLIGPFLASWLCRMTVGQTPPPDAPGPDQSEPKSDWR